MNKPSYKIETSADGLWYEFVSDSQHKSIRKGVGYYLYEENDIEYAELAFGDILPNGNIDIKAISDNQDMVIVLSTVIITLYNFFELYPQKTVVFTGSSASRNRLYRAIISKLFEEGRQFFDVSGINYDGSKELFIKNKDYLAFQISLKNE
ncbi:MAG: DUF6934 family protein [Emticicia sp.]|uniref:DUF6934 family protein n=1 Tax=Emticicia sp. TaxID=1930953 RepID=UPI003BA704A1